MQKNFVVYEEAFQKSLEYFNGDELAVKVWLDKYSLKNNEGNLLERTPVDMHRRLAKEFARVEKKKFKQSLTEDQIFELFDKFKYIIPGGSVLYGIGNPYQYVSSGNCFVIPAPHDSLLGIMHTDAQIAQIACRRGGVGWDLSKLRPEGLGVKNSARTTSGAVGFLKRFSYTVREIGQNGRRAASLVSMSVHHPDILQFIKCKHNLQEITGANISVQLTDEFLEAVKHDKEYELRWPVSLEHAETQKLAYPLVHKKIKAKEIWDAFVHSAWLSAEPGCMFIDRVHRESPAAVYKGFKEESSNPCGEQYLSPYASCRLLALNLYSYVQEAFTQKAFFNYELFNQHVGLIQRLGDDLVDLEVECIDRILTKINSDPEPEEIKQPGISLWENIKKTALADRRMGCGFTGLADAVAAIGLPYGSPESIKFIENLQKSYAHGLYSASVAMAKELGSFACYDKALDKKSEFIQRLESEWPDLVKEMYKHGRRNMLLMTVAPAGSISCLTQTSSGLEPVFMLSYQRKKKGNPGDKNFKSDYVDALGDHWSYFDVQHHGFTEWQKVTGKKEIKDSPYHKSTALDIDWKERVKLQGVIQRWTDNSLSSTVNLPSSISESEVSQLYLEAWKKGLKGITIYRQGCREGVLTDKKPDGHIVHTKAPKRPKELPCEVYHIKAARAHDKTKSIDYLVIVGLLNGVEPYEVFAMENGHIAKDAHKGKLIKQTRGHYRLVLDTGEVIENITKKTSEFEDALTRSLSCGLRHGANVQFIVSQLEKSEGEIYGFSKAIARALKKYIKEGSQVYGEECPECGAPLIRASGCKQCSSCVWTLCG